MLLHLNQNRPEECEQSMPIQIIVLELGGVLLALPALVREINEIGDVGPRGSFLAGGSGLLRGPIGRVSASARNGTYFRFWRARRFFSSRSS